MIEASCSPPPGAGSLLCFCGWGDCVCCWAITPGGRAVSASQQNANPVSQLHLPPLRRSRSVGLVGLVGAVGSCLVAVSAVFWIVYRYCLLRVTCQNRLVGKVWTDKKYQNSPFLNLMNGSFYLSYFSHILSRDPIVRKSFLMIISNKHWKFSATTVISMHCIVQTKTVCTGVAQH